VLAGVYSHTASNIVAAPMAHFIAKKMSRFWYSHDSFYMPCYGAQQMLNEENMIMKFRNVGGKQVTFHQAMNYLYRPKETENSAMYKFYMEMEFTSVREAGKANIPFYEFTEDHPFQSTDAVIYRMQKGKQDCVPVFSWTFIGSTKGFERSMLEEVSLTDPQYQKKEEYAQRFMIVFLPFRKKEDLIEDGSFQRAFQTAHKEGKFSDEMIAIANNIQAIQNSIESGIPENGLSSRTILPEDDKFDNQNGEEEGMGYEDLLSTIGDLLSPVPEGVQLEADATFLNPDFSGKQLQGPKFVPEEETEQEKEKERENLCSVIQRAEDVDEAAADTDFQENTVLPYRFQTETSELNSLLLRQENVLIPEEGADETDGNLVVAADACGSWQSIVNWGKRQKLDAEQEVAFQVLAATYVLTFNDEAKDNLEDEAAAELIKNNHRLLQLARRDPEQTTKKPLRMFVTGPAGAGKCKEQSFSLLPCHKYVPNLTKPFFCFSQIIGGGSCICKTVQSKYQPSFQQQDNPYDSNDRSSCYGDRWSNNSFRIPLHARAKLRYTGRH
jgi:hypothetical protein